MLDLEIAILTLGCCYLLRNAIIDVITLRYLTVSYWIISFLQTVVYKFYCMALYYSMTRRHLIKWVYLHKHYYNISFIWRTVRQIK